MTTTIYIPFLDACNNPLTGRKVTFTCVSPPTISSSYLAVGDTITRTVDTNGTASASLIPATYAVGINTNPQTEFYAVVTEGVFTPISASVKTGSAVDVTFHMIDSVSDWFNVKKLSVTPVAPSIWTFSGSIIGAGSTSSFTDTVGDVTFNNMVPGIYQCLAKGKVETSWYISVPATGGSENGKDLIVVTPAKGIKVTLSDSDRSYVLTVSSSDARYIQQGGSIDSASYVATASWAINAVNGGTTLNTGSTYPFTSSWALNALSASTANQLASGSSIMLPTIYADAGFLASPVLDIEEDIVTLTGFWNFTSSVNVQGAAVLTTNSTASYAKTASWALNSGTTLNTGSTYPITASWANKALVSYGLTDDSTTWVSDGLGDDIWIENNNESVNSRINYNGVTNTFTFGDPTNSPVILNTSSVAQRLDGVIGNPLTLGGIGVEDGQLNLIDATNADTLIIKGVDGAIDFTSPSVIFNGTSMYVGTSGVNEAQIYLAAQQSNPISVAAHDVGGGADNSLTIDTMTSQVSIGQTFTFVGSTGNGFVGTGSGIVGVITSSYAKTASRSDNTTSSSYSQTSSWAVNSVTSSVVIWNETTYFKPTTMNVNDYFSVGPTGVTVGDTVVFTSSAASYFSTTTTLKTGSITGSLLGTSSWATNAVSSSYPFYPTASGFVNWSGNVGIGSSSFSASTLTSNQLTILQPYTGSVYTTVGGGAIKIGTIAKTAGQQFTANSGLYIGQEVVTRDSTGTGFFQQWNNGAIGGIAINPNGGGVTVNGIGQAYTVEPYLGLIVAGNPTNNSFIKISNITDRGAGSKPLSGIIFEQGPSQYYEKGAIIWDTSTETGQYGRGDMKFCSNNVQDASNITDTYLTSSRMIIKWQTGWVGIGNVAIPSASLHISGSSASASFKVSSPTNQNLLFVSGSGNVGVGTETPVNALDVVGNISCSFITASVFAQNGALIIPSWPTVTTSSAVVATGSMVFNVTNSRLYIYTGTTWKSSSFV